MKRDKKNIKEPYAPEHTPSPPQIIDPSGQKERSEDDAPVENREQQPKNRPKNPGDKKERPKLLSDDTEIADETTI